MCHLKRMLAALYILALALGVVEGQAPSGAPILGRIVGAPTPARSVAANLVPVSSGTTYYTDNPAYDFEGEGSPDDWCKTSNDNNCVCQSAPYSASASYKYKCAAGRQQSPVDMSSETLQASGITADLLMGAYPAVLTPNYSTAAIVNVSNPGHGTPQINVAPGSPNNTLTFGGNRTFELVQIHFHAAAEHTFNGTRANVEAHVVHKDPATNGLAVFGFLFERSGRSGRLPDPLLEFTLNNRPNSTYTDASGKMAWNATVVPTPVDLQALLSPYYGGHFLYYQGSLTTPPCTEGVQWFFFPRLLDMSGSQLDTFEEYAGENYKGTNTTAPENYRPTQPLNGRTVELY